MTLLLQWSETRPLSYSLRGVGRDQAPSPASQKDRVGQPRRPGHHLVRSKSRRGPGEDFWTLLLLLSWGAGWEVGASFPEEGSCSRVCRLPHFWKEDFWTG